MITEIVGFTAVAAVAAVATRCGYKIPVIPSYILLVAMAVSLLCKLRV